MMKISPFVILAVVALPLLGQTCPFNMTDDPHPGQCGAYRDANQDSICDLSQATASNAATGRANRPPHHIWQIFLAVGSLSLATELAVRRRKELAFRLQTAWNWLLLLAFLLCSLTGLYFIIPQASRPTPGLDMSYWHTETGLAFIAVGLYHALRRLGCMFHGLKACFSAK